MKMWEAVGKNIRITLQDGNIYDGIGEYYTSALDNTIDDDNYNDGVAFICIGDFALYENEILSIEAIDVQPHLHDVKLVRGK
jgi:hypothetical protein